MTNQRHKSNLQRVSAILNGALRDSGLGERLEERAPLMKWSEIVGEKIAHHIRAVDLEDGIGHGSFTWRASEGDHPMVATVNPLNGTGEYIHDNNEFTDTAKVHSVEDSTPLPGMVVTISIFFIHLIIHRIYRKR